MPDSVKLIGLDFGTTTSSAVVAAAEVRCSAIGRMELDFQEEVYRSDLVFTPLKSDDRLDMAQVEHLLDAWLEAGHVQCKDLFGGGAALITGLTAQKENASALVALIRRRLGDALIATADDPCLESWLAFMGNCAALSRIHPDKFILNFDIGGGTTNIALGRDRQVTRTGCLFLGARHVQFVPGSYQIVLLSRYAEEHLQHLHINKRTGDELTTDEVDAMVTFYLGVLESIVLGQSDADDSCILKNMEQVRYRAPAEARDAVVTFSGGVGELIYRSLQGAPWPTKTHFGDLGIDLAQRIAQSSVWANSLHQYRPQSAGRATVYGLLRHTTEVSGNTLFLGDPAILPLADLPVLGCVRGDSAESHVRDVLTLVKQSSRGGCIQVRLGSHAASLVRDLGQRFARILQEVAFPPTHPLVLLVEENLGKVLGQYVTLWGALPLRVLVIDEVAFRDAQYVLIGSPREQVVPVSFYGLQ